MDKLSFGDFIEIEQKRYGVKNEMYQHKVIGTSESNTWVDVPVQSPSTETVHEKIEPVVSCICCGVCETEVLKYRIKDVRFSMPDKPMESIVNCPCCNGEVAVVLKPYEEAVAGLMDLLWGIGKTGHFQGQGKCECGKLVVASLHVTAGDF